MGSKQSNEKEHRPKEECGHVSDSSTSAESSQQKDPHKVSTTKPVSSSILCSPDHFKSTQPKGDSNTVSPNLPVSLYDTTLTCETANFFRLARLLLDVCNDAMRDLMQSKIQGGELILTKRIALNKHDLERHLHECQKKIVFPQSGLVKYQQLDFTLMYTVVRNVFHEDIEQDSKKNKRWGKTPTAGDDSLLAAIERIRLIRNEFFGHFPSTQMKNSTFNDLWTKIQSAVDKISGHIDLTVSSVCYKEVIGKLAISSTDPELDTVLEKRFELEKKWNDLTEMEVETDVKLEELINIRRQYRKKHCGLAESSRSKDGNLGQTEVFLAKYIQENKFYVETKMFQEVEQFLKENKCVILVGKEGSGKTEMAVHLMFKYSEYKGFVVRKVRNPQDFGHYYDPLGKTFIFVDNVFDCSDGVLKEWWQTFDLMGESIPSQTETKFEEYEQKDLDVYTVLTTRPQKLKDARKKMKFIHYLLKKHTKVLDSDKALERTEKKDILLKKMEFARNRHNIDEKQFNEEEWRDILDSSPPFGFPLCARLFACDESYRQCGVRFFANPQMYVLSKLKQIIDDDESRQTEVLFVLILIYHIQGEPFICSNTDKCWEVLCDLQITEELKLKKEHVDDLTDVVPVHREVYVRESDKHELQFIHPSVQEAVEQYFFETYTKKAIEILPLTMLFQRIHTNKTVEPNHFTHFVSRVLDEIKNQNVCDVFKCKAFKELEFSNYFLKQITQDVHDFKSLLSTKDHIHDNFPFIYWFTAAVKKEIVIDLLNHEMMKQACSDKELKDQYFFSLLASCLSQEMKDITEYILERYSNEGIQNDYRCKVNEPTSKSNKCLLSPLLEATIHQNELAIQILLKNKATFPSTAWKGWPFLTACYDEQQIGCSKFLQTLLEMEERMLTKNENEETLKYEDVSDENTFSEKVVLTIKKSHEKYGTLKYILLNLIEIPELEVTDQLLKAFCSLPDFSNCSDNQYQNPLNFSDEHGNSILHRLLRNFGYSQENFLDDSGCINEDAIPEIDEYATGNDIELKAEKTEYSETGFFHYTEMGAERYLQTLKLLYENKTNFNMKNKMGQTPLMIEVSKTNPSLEIIRLLLSYGANPNDEDSLGRTSIHLLLLHSSSKQKIVYECLIVLVRYGADVNRKDRAGVNPIFIELRRKSPRLQILSGLLAGEIDMNVLDANRRTPLDVAMKLSMDENKRLSIIKVLLRSKTLRVQGQSNMSFTMAISSLEENSQILKQLVFHESCKFPLHDCIEANVDEETKINTLKFLLSHDIVKCKISVVNDESETLLITAARICPDMYNLFDFLLTKNVDVDAKDNADKTALHYLIESDQVELSERRDALDRILSMKPRVDEETTDGKQSSPLLIAMQSIVNTSYLLISDSNDVQTAMENLPSATESFPENQSKYTIKRDISKVSYHGQISHPEKQNIFISTEIVAKILDLVETNVNLPVDEKGRTYLHYCASSKLGDKNALSICERLVKLGVNVDQKDKDGLTCIDMAFKFTGENYDTLVFLIEKSSLQGLDIDASLEHLADKSHLDVKIFEYLRKNVFGRIKPKRNLLHYLASIKYYPKSQKGSEIEELFSCLLQSDYFSVNEQNDEGKIPLHVAIESNASVSCVLCFLKFSLESINKTDSDHNTALHLVLNSEREDDDACTIVKEMLNHNADVNARNDLGRTPLMVAITCRKDRSKTIAEILKRPCPDLMIKDRSGFTILHHCVEGLRDDFTSCTLLSLFLDSGIPVPLNVKSSVGLTPLNSAARNGRRSRVLCLLKLLQRKECKAETVDKEGQSPLLNTAVKLKGKNPLVILERLVRSYIFLVHGASPELVTNSGNTVFDICCELNYSSLLKLLRTESSNTNEMYDITKRAWLEVARQLQDKTISGEVFQRNEFSFEHVLDWSKTTFDEKMKSLIRDSLPFLSHCKFDALKDIKREEDIETLSSALEFESQID